MCMHADVPGTRELARSSLGKLLSVLKDCCHGMSAQLSHACGQVHGLVCQIRNQRHSCEYLQVWQPLLNM